MLLIKTNKGIFKVDKVRYGNPQIIYDSNEWKPVSYKPLTQDEKDVRDWFQKQYVDECGV